MSKYSPTVPPCCRYLHWQQGAAQGDLNHAAKQAARNPTQRNLDTVAKAKAERDRTKASYDRHRAEHYPEETS